MPTAYAHNGMAVNWLAKNFRLLQDRVEVLEKAASKKDSHESHHCERKSLSLCEALGVKEWQWNVEAAPYVSLAPGSWGYTANSELEDSLVELKRLYKEEFGRDIDEEEKDSECETVARGVDIPVPMVAEVNQETVEHVISVPVQAQDADDGEYCTRFDLRDNKDDDYRRCQDITFENSLSGPMLWIPTGRDVFAHGSALREELLQETTVFVQKWWRRWQRERQLIVLGKKVCVFTSSVFNGRRDCEIPVAPGLGNSVWFEYGQKALVYLICETQNLWGSKTMLPKNDDFDRAAVMCWTLWSTMWAKLWNLTSQLFDTLQKEDPVPDVRKKQLLKLPCYRGSLQLSFDHFAAIRSGESIVQSQIPITIFRKALSLLVQFEPKWKMRLDRMEMNQRANINPGQNA